MKLISLMPLNIREAEKKKDEKPADENPFVAADDAGDDADTTDSEDGADQADEKDTEAKTGEEGQSLSISFNPSRVRKYNDSTFKGNRGAVTNISKYGLTVTLPDQQTIFVNFDDIL